MGKLTGPLFSLTASGTIGEALTYATWKGVQYVRTRVIPSNPQSAAQVAVRDAFESLSNLWNTMSALGRTPWTSYAGGKPLTDRNAHVQWNLPRINGDANFADYLPTRPEPGTLAPTAMTAAGGVGQFTTTITAPTPPTGWTVAAAVAVGVEDLDPAPPVQPDQGYTEDLTAPYAPTVVVPAGTYRVWGFLRYTTPTGETRYSGSIIAVPATVVVT